MPTYQDLLRASYSVKNVAALTNNALGVRIVLIIPTFTKINYNPGWRLKYLYKSETIDEIEFSVLSTSSSSLCSNISLPNTLHIRSTSCSKPKQGQLESIAL